MAKFLSRYSKTLLLQKWYTTSFNKSSSYSTQLFISRDDTVGKNHKKVSFAIQLVLAFSAEFSLFCWLQNKLKILIECKMRLFGHFYTLCMFTPIKTHNWRKICSNCLQTRGLRGDNMVSRRSSRLDYTMSNIHTKTTTINGSNKKNGSVTATPNHENGNQETANLITIEATQDMIKVESHQLWRIISKK